MIKLKPRGSKAHKSSSYFSSECKGLPNAYPGQPKFCQVRLLRSNFHNTKTNNKNKNCSKLNAEKPLIYSYKVRKTTPICNSNHKSTNKSLFSSSECSRPYKCISRGGLKNSRKLSLLLSTSYYSKISNKNHQRAS